MPDHVIKLPDVGEGVAEAELVEWHVKVGDLVREDAVLAAVMTDKATVEIPSPVDGEVTWLGGEVGDTIAVGSPLLRIATAAADRGSASRGAPDGADRGVPHKGPMDDGEGEAPIADGMAPEGEDLPPPAEDHTPTPSLQGEGERRAAKTASAASRAAASAAAETLSLDVPRSPSRSRGGVGRAGIAGSGRRSAEADRPLASPAVRLRAREAGVDLRQVRGSGPAGRITHEDLDAFLQGGGGVAPATGPAPARNTQVEEIKVVGLRRRIAEKMAVAKSRIPHITYVEEVDVSALEDLRAALNQNKASGRPKLTLLPFLIRALVRAIAEQPAVNALFDDEAGVIRRHGAVHAGVATQTPAGLVVPVIRHAEALGLWDCAAELARLAEAARTGTATREELSGSTITITSLGALGGIVTTPVINHPEVAIVGVNKIVMRPVWDGAQFIPRKMMNLSSSFDHRVIDGWDAAVFVQRVKALLETPALIFVEG